MKTEKLQSDLISNEILIENYLTPEMEKYFYKKFNYQNIEYIKIEICELLKFLTMCHNIYGDIPFNDEIDEVWHLWILQTLQYRELMDKLPGKIFINHCSNDYEDERKEQESEEVKINKQISYLVSYVYNFGDFTLQTAQFWPMVDILMQNMSLNLSDLNKYLRSLGEC